MSECECVCAREWVYVLAGESAVFVVYIFQRQIAKYSTKSFFIKSRCLFLITILGAKSKSLQFWYFERANGKHNVVVCNQLTSAQLFWLWCKVGNNFSFICYFLFFWGECQPSFWIIQYHYRNDWLTGFYSCFFDLNIEYKKLVKHVAQITIDSSSVLASPQFFFLKWICAP